MNLSFDENDEIEAMARAIAVSLDGDDGDWQGFITTAYNAWVAFHNVWERPLAANDD